MLGKRIKPFAVIAVVLAVGNILYTVIRAIIAGTHLTVYNIWSIAGCAVCAVGLTLALISSAKRERRALREKLKEEKNVE